MAKLFFILVALFIVPLGHAQSRSAPPALRTKEYEHAFYRLFADQLWNTEFSLKTSWIPGKNSAGMMRYQISARPSIVPGAAYDSALPRLSQCTFTLNLLDEGGFLVREEQVPFQLSVDNQGRVNGRYANTWLPLTSAEYQSISGYEVAWNCK